jgi:hypothetical protein
MGIGRGLALLAATLALAAPASASGSSTLSVENGAIRFVGDAGDNTLDVYQAENGEQSLHATDVTLGPGCHAAPPDQQQKNGNILCARMGVNRIEFVGGDGRDFFNTWADIDLSVQADMGDGNDYFGTGSVGTDLVELGPGRDVYFDGPGNDIVDGGLGNDDMAKGVSSGDGTLDTGDDMLSGGDGDDNLDGGNGNDTVDGGAGNDHLLPSQGNDTLLGGSGNDSVAAEPGVCYADPGNDSMSGGPGDDRICGGPGSDALDGGDGSDSINAVDFGRDAPVMCGDGTDFAWLDAADSIGADCEQQGDQSIALLPSSGLLPVALPCGDAPCTGEMSLFATPTAARPDSSQPPPLTVPKRVGKALGKTKFKHGRRGKRTVRVKLTKAGAKRLRKLGRTTVEARTVLVQHGVRHTVLRTFRVRPKN